MVVVKEIYTITCCNCNYQESFDDVTLADNSARFHVQTNGAKHLITCTRPAHNKFGSIPIIVFETKITQGETTK